MLGFKAWGSGPEYPNHHRQQLFWGVYTGYIRIQEGFGYSIPNDAESNAKENGQGS